VWKQQNSPAYQISIYNSKEKLPEQQKLFRKLADVNLQGDVIMGFGNIIVMAVLAAIVVLCIRSIYKEHKGGGCTGSCSSCQGGSCGGCGGDQEYTITIKKKREKVSS